MRIFGRANAPSDVVVDEDWYLSQYPDVKSQVKPGLFQSARHHFVKYGYREGRVPARPKVDEAWYLAAYPDVARAVRQGRVKSAYDHFIKNGYREGRKPNRSG